MAFDATECGLRGHVAGDAPPEGHRAGPIPFDVTGEPADLLIGALQGIGGSKGPPKPAGSAQVVDGKEFLKAFPKRSGGRGVLPLEGRGKALQDPLGFFGSWDIREQTGADNCTTEEGNVNVDEAQQSFQRTPPASRSGPLNSVVGQTGTSWDKNTDFDVVVERDAEGFFVASVPALQGCHTQAQSLDQVMDRVREVIVLCLEEQGLPAEPLEFLAFKEFASRHDSSTAGQGQRPHLSTRTYGFRSDSN